MSSNQPPRPHGVRSLMLRITSPLVPRLERERWLEEWESELERARERGVSAPRRLLWSLGFTAAAIRFRGEDLLMNSWGREIRQAVRGLVRRPGFAAVTVLTLALGIGVNTAMFSVVNGVLLRPLAYVEPDRLVAVHTAFPAQGFDEFWMSPPEFFELGERSSSFASLGAYRDTQLSIGGGDQPERVTAAGATSTLFTTLGVEPMLGRVYRAEEDLPGAPPTIVLSHELWERVFGADSTVIGRMIDVNGGSTEVVGVMPPGFDVDEMGIEAWAPLGLDPTQRTNGRGSHYLYVIGRLSRGADVQSAATELEANLAKWDELNPGTHNPTPDLHPMFMRSLQEQVVGDVREALFLLLGAVGFVLLIACANVANLLLARGEDRQREVAVRVAMGAGRARLIGQFLVEGVVLSVTGGLVGLGLAWLSLKGLRIVGSADLPRLREITLDARVLLLTAGVAVVTGILFGLAPARHAARSSSAGGKLRDGDARSTSGTGRTRLRSLLVVSEVALAMMLAVGAGLMIRSFQQLTSVDPGFDSRGLLTFQVYLPPTRYGEEADVMAFHRRMEEELAAIPGVTNVAAMVGLPPLRDMDANDTDFEDIQANADGTPVEGQPNENVDFYQTITPGYLDAMKIPVLRGRDFTASDTRASAPVALVNETLERVFFSGQSAVGKRLRTGGDDSPWIEIVGVVEDVKQAGLDTEAGTELYFALDQATPLWYLPRSMNVVVRTAGDPENVAPAVRQTMSRLDSSLPLAGLQSMESVLAGARARPRFLTSVLLGFALLALALAAVGTYGVMSYSVAQRSREVGIRMALGAEGRTVLKLVLRQGMIVTGTGIAIGTVGALALSGALQRLLFEVAPRDWITFLLVPVLLAATSVVALWIPAHRATRVNPVKVLREG